MDTFSKMMFPAHRLQIQIFDTYDIIEIGYLSLLFMQVIFSLVSDMCMDPRHFFLLFFVTIAPLPAMTQFSLRFRQFFLAVSEIVRITCMFSIGIYI